MVLLSALTIVFFVQCILYLLNVRSRYRDLPASARDFDGAIKRGQIPDGASVEQWREAVGIRHRLLRSGILIEITLLLTGLGNVARYISQDNAAMSALTGGTAAIWLMAAAYDRQSRRDTAALLETLESAPRVAS